MKKKVYGSLLLNLFTTISVIVCAIILSIRGPKTFRMFTTQSNIVSGIVAAIIVVFDILILLKKYNEIPNWLKIVKMIATTGVTLTFFVVVFYLGFVAVAEGYSYFILFRSTNICFHLLTPISAILSFILFEGRSNIKFKYTFFNMVHMICYAIFYTINVFTHLNSDGSVNKDYDWYYFVLGENWTYIFAVLGILIVTYGIGLVLWFTNKKLELFKEQ
ncbi:hypothetical protein EI71_00087 [Anaeroplasma bactoclasticum]|jgi:hypothetical protein|uniref:FAR-17a/AIG1-like protein n=1 Tax=Anaeroplasma bactoclasticum TaxID=2088 RepID=A0A397S174_9MOLU|nr:hypothetical protein [Anaeroplasma bactoclasticum]RIA78526.1 hypothetical protein EI71_00087 [Anaeroplasma bactoclasticum]